MFKFPSRDSSPFEKSRHRRGLVLANHSEGGEERLEHRALTSSPYVFKLSSALQAIVQPETNAVPLTVAFLDKAIKPLTKQSPTPSPNTDPVVLLGAGSSTPSFFRVDNGAELLGTAGEYAPNIDLDTRGPDPTSVSPAQTTDLEFSGSTWMFNSEGQFVPEEWSFSVTSQDSATATIVDAGPGSGAPPSSGSVGGISISVSQMSQQTVTWTGPATGPAPGTLLVDTGSSIATDFTGTGTSNVLTWNVIGDTVAGQQEYIVDNIQFVNQAPHSSGSISSLEDPYVQLTTSEGTISFGLGGAAVVPGTNVVYSVSTSVAGYITTSNVTLVRPFTSEVSPAVETQETISISSTLAVTTDPTTSVPTGTSSSQEALSWSYGSHVSVTNPLG